jgi:hypothetical protein
MQQLNLLNETINLDKNIIIDNIKANFVKIGEDMYDVLLEINSNKFLLRIEATMSKLESFEIIAVKGFVDLTLNVYKILKRIITKLYFEY